MCLEEQTVAYYDVILCCTVSFCQCVGGHCSFCLQWVPTYTGFGLSVISSQASTSGSLFKPVRLVAL